MELTTEPQDQPQAQRPEILQREASIGDSFKQGWDNLWQNLPILLLVWIIMVVINSIGGVFFAVFQDEGNVFSQIYWSIGTLFFTLMVGYPLSFGTLYVYLRVIRGLEVSVNHLFEPFSNYLNVVLATLLLGIVISVGFLFFIIPGVIFMCKLAFVPFLVVDRKMAAWDAFQESWRLTNGHAGQIFLIGALAMPIMFAGTLLLFIGVIPAGIWIGLALSAFYNSINPPRRTEVDEFAPIG